MKKKYVGFGDFLLRLSPPGYRRFSQAPVFETYYTGAESNVCASLAVMGERTALSAGIRDNCRRCRDIVEESRK